MNAYPEKRVWFDRILRYLQLIEMPEKEADKVVDVSEPFLENAWSEVCKAIYPAARLKKGATVTPRMIGAIVAYKHAYCQNLEQALPRIKTTLKKKVLGSKAEEILKAAQKLEKDIILYRKRSLRVVERCFRIALQQEARQTREFLEGFTDALRTGTVTRTGTVVGMNSTTLICGLVVWFGPEIRTKFKSVAHFHGCLTRALGHNTAGDLARIQKLCNRLQLNFREPGRPKIRRNN